MDSYFLFAFIRDQFFTSYFLLLVVIYFFIVKVLQLLSTMEAPKLTYLNESNPGTSTASNCDFGKNRIGQLIERCPMLKEPYRPPWLWGRNGHVQTAIYAILGHANLVCTANKRHYVSLPDGTTVTFDVFEPLITHSTGDFTLALCPGIGNSSESPYIRTCVHNAQKAGFRIAVLNHLGALKDERLTSPRIFKYGCTEEYTAMITKLIQLYTNTRFICIGFSMGGNIVTKYLGEQPEAVDRIVLGVSVCQGYDAASTATNLHSYESGRRIYEFIMTENIKCLLRNHRDAVVKPFVDQGIIDEKLLWASTSFLALDEHYSRKISSFKTLESYYGWCSSINVIDQIKIPTVFLNANDDPIMPNSLWEPVKKIAESKSHTLFALTQHGGHLGFLEGSSFGPSGVTWLDRLIVQLSNSAIEVYGS